MRTRYSERTERRCQALNVGMPLSDIRKAECIFQAKLYLLGYGALTWSAYIGTQILIEEAKPRLASKPRKELAKTR